METLHRHRRLIQGGAAPPPSTPSNFDMNMVIILAALLCALICALGLNSIVRCALRCSRRLASLDANSGEVLAPAAAARAVSVTRRGLRRSALRQIPVVVYGGDGGVKVIATECAICLGELADGEKVRVLPRCKHGFHVRCIDPWLASHTSCPTCRRSIAEAGAAVAVGAAAVAFGGGSVEHADVAVGVGDLDGG